MTRSHHILIGRGCLAALIFLGSVGLSGPAPAKRRTYLIAGCAAIVGLAAILNSNLPPASEKNEFNKLIVIDENSALPARTPMDLREKASPELRRTLEVQGMTVADEIEISLKAVYHYEDSLFFSGKPFFVDPIIEFKDREDLKRIANAYESSRGPRATDIYRRAGGNFVALNDLMPVLVSEIVGTKASANCFNTTLRVRTPSFPQAHTDTAQMERALEQDYDRLGKGDRLKPGDVLEIYDKKGNEYLKPGPAHTAIYAGGNLFFHKASAFSCCRFVYERFDDLISPRYLKMDFRFHRPR